MKINVNALLKAFEKEWEVSVEPSDMPEELYNIITIVDHFMGSYEDYDDLPLAIKQKMTKKEVESLVLSEEQLKILTILENAQEELHTLNEELQNKGIPAEDIKKIFITEMEKIS